jgi:SAM-dependent methyltransferase
MRDSTLAYYAENAAAFFEATVDKPMEQAYRHFLPLVPPGGHILDAGCGSGRDSRHFKTKGFRVTAFDASPQMAGLAGPHLQQRVHCMEFLQVPWDTEFDALWASASLLHLPFGEIAPALRHLVRTLRHGAPFYASFKYGDAEWTKEGRHFTALNEARLLTLLEAVASLELLESWLSPDNRPGRNDEMWLNVLMKRR